MFGIQSWVALSKAAEEASPEFFHHGKASLPLFEDQGARVRIIAGSLHGKARL
jgi:redox-sensitive bicupin YhaK (pirin superfamily)